jgi:hypothetical protein
LSLPAWAGRSLPLELTPMPSDNGGWHWYERLSLRASLVSVMLGTRDADDKRAAVTLGRRWAPSRWQARSAMLVSRATAMR